MYIHALQTGIVHVKADFLRGSAAAGNPLTFFGKLLTDKVWVDLPIYAWVIDHSEGIFIVDTGDCADTLHNFISQSTYTIMPDEQIGAQLMNLGIAKRDIRKIILTHLHGDHVNGLADLQGIPTFLGEVEYAFYRNRLGGLFSRRTTRLPNWFDPQPIEFQQQAFGAFPRSFPLTKAGDMIAVPTPGHTAGHLSVIINYEDVSYLLAGDVTYDQEALLSRTLQGPSLAIKQHPQTLQPILSYVQTHPTIYLPSHDWESGNRLITKSIIYSV